VDGLEATLSPLPLKLSTPRPSPCKLQKTPFQTPSEDPSEPSPQGSWGQAQRRTVDASVTAQSWGGERVRRASVAAPRCRGRGIQLVIIPSRVYTKLGPLLEARPGIDYSQERLEIAVVVGEPRSDHKWIATGTTRKMR